jgi:hypothetical protein
MPSVAPTINISVNRIRVAIRLDRIVKDFMVGFGAEKDCGEKFRGHEADLADDTDDAVID